MARTTFTTLTSWFISLKAKLATRQENLLALRGLKTYSDLELSGMGLSRANICRAVTFGR
ncbi:hypothetical protein [Marinomonas balearica]|uniref:DUF1127 domain-containing protein n=1 Tax=Marinomonas balearica TaxID=491947 RepID=A0A4R6MDG3_9GAMM|nr:hypothetical protein [Marinomonas balearica]TDO98760.1 hypothetical protein DFP79_1172 [Marinomonas balearica]